MEIELSTVVIFFAAAIAVYISPGPDMLYVASRAMGQGRRAGIISAIGVQTGLIIHMLVAAFGLSAFLDQWPAAYAIIKWMGVAYLVYLGIHALLSKEQGFNAGYRQNRIWSDGRLFRQGLVVNLLNPKIVIFFLAFLPQFVDPANGDVNLQMLFFGALFNLGGFPWILLMAVLFGAAGNWLNDQPHFLRLQRWITGSALLGLAAFVAFDESAKRS